MKEKGKTIITLRTGDQNWEASINTMELTRWPKGPTKSIWVLWSLGKLISSPEKSMETSYSWVVTVRLFCDRSADALKHGLIPLIDWLAYWNGVYGCSFVWLIDWLMDWLTESCIISIRLLHRFEMPFNIWCDGCNNHIGMGVRYNAEKRKIGMYYTTPLWEFRMKCHLCDNYFEFRTDPKAWRYSCCCPTFFSSILHG